MPGTAVLHHQGMVGLFPAVTGNQRMHIGRMGLLGSLFIAERVFVLIIIPVIVRNQGIGTFHPEVWLPGFHRALSLHPS